MNRISTRWCLGLILSVAALGAFLSDLDPALASRVRQLGLGDMARRAGVVFYGECLSRDVVTPEAGGRPYTSYVFRVERPIKGLAADAKSYAFAMATTPDGRGVVGMPVFEVGEEMLLILYPPGAGGMTSPMGLDQGLFRVAKDTSERRRATNGRGNARLFEDVSLPPADRQLIKESRGALELDTLERILRSLVGETRR